jgi:hypothetical protein
MTLEYAGIAFAVSARPATVLALSAKAGEACQKPKNTQNPASLGRVFPRSGGEGFNAA